MNIEKMFEAAKISIAAIIGLYIVAMIISFVPALGVFGGLLSVLSFFVLNPILLGWAGYVTVKKYKGKLADGAMVGAFAGAISSLVNGILSLILLTMGLTAVGASQSSVGAMLGGEIGLMAGIMGLVISVVIFVVGGAICGAIGAYIVGKK